MAFYECKVGGSGGGIPPQLQTDMDSVLNKKLGTSTTYPSTSWAKEVNLMGLLPEKTVSGAVASFPDGADDVPIKTATFDIDPTLDGVSEVNVTQQGKNLFNKADYTYIQAYMMNGTVTYNSSHTLIYMPCKPNTNYTVSRERTNANERFAVAWSKVIPEDGSTVYDINSAPNSGTVGDTMSVSVTTGSDAVYLVIWAWWSSSDSTTAMNTMQIEIGSSATAYTAYTTPETRTISLGQTVYGGSVTVDEDGECELTVDHAHVDLGSLTWTDAGSSFPSNTYKATLSGNGGAYRGTLCGGGYTVVESKAALLDMCIYPYNNGSTIYIKNDNCADATAMTTALSGVYIVYHSTATPTTSTLTPITPITSALGVNNIWCDTGDVESLTYRANNKSVLSFDYAFENTWTLYNNALGGTDIIKPVLSFTADGDVSFKYKGVRIYTNTGSNDGFFALRKNGTIVYKQNLATDATAQYTNIPSVDLESGDTVEFCIGFDGVHSGCTFRMYQLT